MADKWIYLDNAATTPVKPEVFEVMVPWFTENFGNASTIYGLGRESKKAIETAREQLAKGLNATAREIYFTSGGTESDNWAIKGIASAHKSKGKHIITSTIEHHAVLDVCKYLETEGYEVTYLPVDQDGLVTPEQVEAAIRPDTILITIMFANNEIGTVQPVAEIGKVAKKHGVLFHTDAVQAVGSIKVDVADLNVDLLSVSSHKLYGPKGIGALYIRKGVKIHNFFHGGGQERGRRASTENVPAIVGFGKAVELATEDLDAYQAKLIALRDRTISEVMAKIPYVKLNGHATKRLPGNCNFSFEFIEGESLLLMLDMKRIAASSGSACTSGSLDPSHVLLAIGLPHEIAHGSLRVSFGATNDDTDADALLNELPAIVQRLRDMSPLYEVVKNKK